MKKIKLAMFLSALFLSVQASAATAVFFNHFEELAHEGGVNLSSDTFRLVLSNGAPSAAWTDNSSITSEVANGLGYTTGGALMAVTSSSQTSGTYTWVGTDVEWTLTGEVSFRYAILNDTTVDKLICYWDFTTAQVASTAITVNIGTLLTVSFTEFDRYNIFDFIVRDGDLRLKLQLVGDTRIFRNAA